MECPLVHRKITAWAFPPHLAQTGYWHKWRFGARLGENADGSFARRATSLASPAPGVRKAPVREVMGGLRARGKVGYPPSLTTDAQLGYEVMA